MQLKSVNHEAYLKRCLGDIAFSASTDAVQQQAGRRVFRKVLVGISGGPSILHQFIEMYSPTAAQLKVDWL